jgi:hypothetical protein
MKFLIVKSSPVFSHFNFLRPNYSLQHPEEVVPGNSKLDVSSLMTNLVHIFRQQKVKFPEVTP